MRTDEHTTRALVRNTFQGTTDVYRDGCGSRNDDSNGEDDYLWLLVTEADHETPREAAHLYTISFSNQFYSSDIPSRTEARQILSKGRPSAVTVRSIYSFFSPFYTTPVHHHVLSSSSSLHGPDLVLSEPDSSLVRIILESVRLLPWNNRSATT